MVETRPVAKPRLTAARMVAGVLAGLAGGIAFGILMILPAITERGLGEVGMLTKLGALLGTQSLPLLWIIHVAMSALFGLVFAAFVAPRDVRRVVPLAIGYAIGLWFLGDVVILRLLAGEPALITGGALYDLLGHVAFGAIMGLSYVALFREELGILQDHPGAMTRRGRARARRPQMKS